MAEEPEMTTAQAIEALRPLAKWRGALQHIEEILRAAHQAAGELAELNTRRAEAHAAATRAENAARAAAEAAEAEASARIERAAMRARGGMDAAEERIAEAQRRVEAAENAARAAEAELDRVVKLREQMRSALAGAAPEAG